MNPNFCRPFTGSLAVYTILYCMTVSNNALPKQVLNSQYLHAIDRTITSAPEANDLKSVSVLSGRVVVGLRTLLPFEPESVAVVEHPDTSITTCFTPSTLLFSYSVYVQITNRLHLFHRTLFGG